MIKKCEYEIKNLKNIEIKIITNYQHIKERLIQQTPIFIEIIKEIYNNTNIYNLRFIIDSYEYFEIIFKYIILVLNNTKNKIEIFLGNETKREMFINNVTLKYLLIQTNIKNNISEIEIYWTSEENKIFELIDYFNKFSYYIKRMKVNNY